MFYLHLSNRTENLIHQLAEVLRLDDDRDPFSPEYFLIQSQGMERMLSQNLAQRFVSWCNYEYMLPTRFFALMADRLGVESGPEEYARDRICWHLENIFRDLSPEDEKFAAVGRYVSGDTNGMKRYQLAQQLANIFDQYQIMRFAMIEGWENGKTATNNPAEVYQMELWNMLRDGIGHSRHRGRFLRDFIDILATDADHGSLLPRRLSVFGLHSLPPVLLNCLQALAAHCDVHLYLLSPCEIFWGDQLSEQVQLKKNISALRDGKQVLEQGLTSHPLLTSLSQQGREFQNMLLEDILFAGEFKSFADPLDHSKPCLLHRVQSDLLKGELTPLSVPLAKDDSVVVVSAHSPHRELMILKDRILHWLDEDPDLALKDIVVMAPDIQEYSGMIPAVFHDIPHSIADRNPAQSNPFLAVYLQFLSLCSSRFGWSEVLDLLGRKEVYPRFDIHEDELELIRHWVVSSGIRWGLSGRQKRDMGLPGKNECTWESGLDRLLMGYATAESGDVDGILPYPDIEGGMAAALGGLSFFCDLLEQAAQQFAGLHSLGEWAVLLSGFADRLFVTENNDGLVELYGVLTDLGQEYGNVHQKGVSFEVIRSWLQGAVEEKRSSAGFLRGQLTFCSMLPMRSIPFQKVCLLGLNDTVFPKNDFHPPFDLLGEKPVPGDRSRRSDDRYQFLEAILSARGSLYISYIGQSIRSNDTLPPSVVVSELLDILRVYGVDSLVDVHPLHGFSSTYFDGSGSLFSYNRQLMEVGSALHGKHDTPDPWWQGRIEGEAKDVCSVAELKSFFRNPQKYFVRDILGIHLGQQNLSVEEHEPFVLDSLQKYLVEQDMINGFLGSSEQRLLQQQVQAAGQWPLGTPGNISFSEKREELQTFVDRVATRKAFGSEEDRFLDGEFCGFHISGRMSSFYSNGSFLFRYTLLKGQDVFAAWLHHCLSAICLDDARETRLLAKDVELVFPAASATAEDLQELLSLFQRGQQTPSILMVEAVFAYAVQSAKNENGGRTAPISRAIKSVEDSLNRGFEAEWELLYQGRSADSFLEQEFIDLCDWFYESIWKRAYVSELI
ncbi:DNA helicase/exodeoxyribonuclease V, gamma subunit [Desulfocapsa sulfexigens DSM 10523]|uniref:DNA helicase/exodeoxyribonuclease V, gamma subunit n=1 Tax=Desulfocapsa sulfexigens (strain DSM 10523 / SB164P1) TaxID=1167006 RepID=M1P5P7_DESSD|nr:exodeoxyribonuclease V subunit gamma [Desulfocapsa sulfexigens]AGF76982.1 DNA helicase/exodeoxyribonuclease V, gamma subunit [Desulfocapsa sulfexigens DSM 10523]